jgi:Na+-transporting NADH:ubiquinone oxidoreductase subunit NqrF
MEQQLNEEQLFNVQQQLNNTHNHVMLSFNMKQHKYVLFDNFNVLVLLKKVLHHMPNGMEQHFWMLKH